MTKVLQEEDYDTEEDDDEEDDVDEDDYNESLTELPDVGKCEDGFRKDENGNCVGGYILLIGTFYWM